MASQWQELEENYFTCSICLDNFKEPKQLPCLHKFCRECLKPVIERAGRELCCPLCKRYCEVPDEGIDGLVTDFHSKGVIEYIQQQKSKEAAKSHEKPVESEGDEGTEKCGDQALVARSSEQPVQAITMSDSGKPETQNPSISVQDDMVCTFTRTRKKYTSQTRYQCYTCNLVGNLGTCVVCASVCHDGHVISSPKYSTRFFCDCGTQEYCQCKALVKRIDGSSAKSEEEEDSGRLGPQNPSTYVRDDMVCTFTKTRKNYTSQVRYQCYTCNLIGNLGACDVCASVCHDGHVISAPRYSIKFFCDCGTQEYCKCQALVKRVGGSPAEYDKEEDSGRLGTRNPSTSVRDDMVCTFTKTRKNYTLQVRFHCYTCNLVGNLGACVVCASVCHDGHALSGPRKSSWFFCDCGTQEYCQCQALVKRHGGSSAKSDKEEDSGRLGTQISGNSGGRVCTFTRTRRNPTAQVWYHCYTCGLVGRLGVCAVCAEVCHEGHDLSNSKFSLGFFCDCGTEEYYPCKCLRVVTTTQ